MGVSGVGGGGYIPDLPIEPESEAAPADGCPGASEAPATSRQSGADDLTGPLFPRSAWMDRGAFSAVMQTVQEALKDLGEAFNWRMPREADVTQQQGGSPVEDPPIRALYGVVMPDPGRIDPSDLDPAPVIDDPDIRMLYGMPFPGGGGSIEPPVVPDDPELRMLYGLPFPGGGGGPIDIVPDDPELRMLYGLPFPGGGGGAPIDIVPEDPDLRMLYGLPAPDLGSRIA